MPDGTTFWLRTLMLVTMGVAILFATYRTVGVDLLETALLYGTMLGIGFVVLARRWLRWYRLVALGGAILGGIVAVELAAYDGSVQIDRFYDSGVPRLRWDGVTFPFILAHYSFVGALVGGVIGIMVGCWLAVRSGLRRGESTLPWYRPSKGAMIGLMFFGSLSAWLAYSVYRDTKRTEAIHAIMDLGGNIYWQTEKDSMEKDSSYKDPIEIDLYDSQVSDAQLDDIIALISPHGRLILTNSRVTAEGVKKLRQALPNCSISWRPPTKDGRRTQAKPD